MAQADSPNTTITSAIDRRGALGLFGRVLGGSAAVAGAGALPAVAQEADWLDPWRSLAKRAENPALMALQPAFQKAWAGYCFAQAEKVAARERCDAIWPATPTDLAFTDRNEVFYIYRRADTDPEGREVPQKGRPPHSPLHYVARAHDLRSALDDPGNGPRSKAGKAIRRLIPIAEQHEAAREAAKQGSGLSAALAARAEAAELLTRVAEQILKQEAQTLVGLHTKARAVSALAAIEDVDFNRSGYAVRAPVTSMLHGVRLAENISRVIGLGDAVVAVA
jgi:hypothetical protein